MSSNLPATVTDDNAPDLFSDARIQLIRDSIAKEAPDTVFRAMIEIARVRNLDPLAKQISVIKYGNVWQVTTTIDGYRAIAESTGTYAGSDEPQFGPATIELDNGKHAPEWASVTVWKFAHGQRVPFSERVYWDEYDGGNFTWKKMPRTMLAKVAESHALRKGFPKVLSGLYTGEEMEQAGPVIDHTTGEIVDAPRSARNAPRAIEASGQVADDLDTPQRATRRQREMIEERWGALRLDPKQLGPQCRKFYGTPYGELSRDHATDLIAKLDQKITEASPNGITRQPPEDAPDDAGLSDDEIRQIGVEIDAEAGPTNAELADHYAS